MKEYYRVLAAWKATPVILLVAVSISVYGGIINNDFVWDDEHIVVENPDTRDLSSIGRVLLSPDEIKPYYRPLNRAFYLVEYQCFGLDPRGFHAFGVFLHTLNVLLLFALAKLLFEESTSALVAALLLAVHPVNSEAVNFISGQNNLFALLFSLLALLLFIHADRRDLWKRTWISGLAFLFGLLSKEQAFMALPLMAAWMLVPGLSPRVGHWRPLLFLIPHAVALSIYIAMRSIALGGPLASDGIFSGLFHRVAQNYYILPSYLALVVFPLHLTIFHSVPKAGLLSVGWLPVAWIAIAAISLSLLKHRSVPMRVGLIWFALNLLPILNIIPIQGTQIAERYLYVPAAGLWLAAADGMHRLYRKVPWKRIIIVAGVVMFCTFAIRTAIRNLDWTDDVTLARSAVETNPLSVRAHFNLGVALKDRGNLEGARMEWEKILKIDPANIETLIQLGTLAALGGDLAGAERYYRNALRLDSRVSMAHFNLGRICEKTGRPREAIEHYEYFVRLAPPLYKSFIPIAKERIHMLRIGNRQ